MQRGERGGKRRGTTPNRALGRRGIQGRGGIEGSGGIEGRGGIKGRSRRSRRSRRVGGVAGSRDLK